MGVLNFSAECNGMGVMQGSYFSGLFALLYLLVGGPSPLLAQASLRPFTAVDGPATAETCTANALGTHPHPALLAQCFYISFWSDAGAAEFVDKPNRLLTLYATAAFNKRLDLNYKRFEDSGKGLRAFEIFFSDEKFDDFKIIDSSFDEKTGIVAIKALLDGNPYFYKIVFVVENKLWRVDNILLFNQGCQLVQSIKDIVQNYDAWSRQLTQCARRRK